MVDEAQVRIEVERIINLVRSQGWDKVEERIEENMVTIVIKKKIAPVAP